MLVRCSPRGMEAAFVARCLGIESHPAIAESRHRGRSPARRTRRWYVRGVAGTRHHHRLTDLSVAALVGRLVDLQIVGKASPMVLFAAAAAVVAVAAVEEAEALVELAAEWAVVAVRAAGEVCYCSSLIDQHCS